MRPYDRNDHEDVMHTPTVIEISDSKTLDEVMKELEFQFLYMVEPY
jgi:hypothetical protein